MATARYIDEKKLIETAKKSILIKVFVDRIYDCPAVAGIQFAGAHLQLRIQQMQL